MFVFNCILALLAGVGVFIAGMNMMGDGLEKSAGSGLKRLLGKISNNRFAGVAVGAVTTAIIQSSSATTVMAIGFVNAGVMSLIQAISIIMGANIGTTVTGLIVSLSALDIGLYASLLAFIGVMMTFFKKDKVKQIGCVLCGFGLLFVGLDLMSSAFGNQVIKDFFRDIFVVIDFPLLLILVGAVFTSIIQSSSAATGLVIIMAGEGAISVQNALFIVLGCNIGTCVTALLASIGTTVNAKRTAFAHLTFNVIGTVIFAVFLWIFATPFVNLLQSLIPSVQMQIAWFHVIFNVTTTLVLVGFVKQIAKLSELVIKEKPSKEDTRQLRYVNDLLLKTPPVAIMQVKQEIEYMSSLARENIRKSVLALTDGNVTSGEEIAQDEGVINFTNKALTKYLIKLSPLVSEHDERTIGAYFHVLNDLERIGDHAKNFYEIATQMQNEGLAFSDDACAEIQEMGNTVSRMFEIAENAFVYNETENLSELTRLENLTDELKRNLTQKHFTRLAGGNCKVEASAYFFSTVAGLERVADHLVNVGFSVLNPTGSQSEARESGELPESAV